MIIPGKFTNHVEYFRKNSSISQAQLGQLVGISRQGIAAIEKNMAVPSVKIAIALAKVLNTSVEKLFHQEWLPPKSPHEEYLEFLREEGLHDLAEKFSSY